ncbi:hypothetical protein VDGD_09640 [Verticillium dahliae]|nr:hypothetical protein VDGD_09640 [Verticillium dahliae]
MPEENNRTLFLVRKKRNSKHDVPCSLDCLLYPRGKPKRAPKTLFGRLLALLGVDLQTRPSSGAGERWVHRGGAGYQPGRHWGCPRPNMFFEDLERWQRCRCRLMGRGAEVFGSSAWVGWEGDLQDTWACRSNIFSIGFADTRQETVHEYRGAFEEVLEMCPVCLVVVVLDMLLLRVKTDTPILRRPTLGLLYDDYYKCLASYCLGDEDFFDLFSEALDPIPPYQRHKRTFTVSAYEGLDVGSDFFGFRQ